MAIYTEEITKVDGATGELIEQERITISRQNKEEFVRLFLATIEQIVNAKLSGSEHNVLYMLQKYTTNNSNLIFYNSEIRRIIAKDLGIKEETVKKAVTKLVKVKLLIRKGRLLYLNPQHFGRGDWQSIKKLRKTLDYEFDFEKMDVIKIDKTRALYEEEGEIARQVIEAKNDDRLEAEVVVDEANKTIDKTLLIKSSDKKKKLIGILRGKIGDIDAKEARREMVEASVKKCESI